MPFVYSQPNFSSLIYNSNFFPSGNGEFLTFDYAQTLYLPKNDFRLSYLSGITPGAAIPGVCLVLDDTKSISGLGSVGCTSLSIAGTSISASSFAALTGVTPGTALASKAIILDASKNITGVNSLTASTLTGTLQTASQPNITSIGTLSSLSVTNGVIASTLSGTLQTASQPNITSIGTLSSLNVGGSVLISTQAGYLTSITTGTGSASKALVLDASRNISGIANLSCSTINGMAVASAIDPNNAFFAKSFRLNQSTPTTVNGYWLQNAGTLGLVFKPSTFATDTTISNVTDTLTLDCAVNALQVQQNWDRSLGIYKLPIQMWVIDPRSGYTPRGQLALNPVQNGSSVGSVYYDWQFQCNDPNTMQGSSISFIAPQNSSSALKGFLGSRSVSINNSIFDQYSQLDVNGYIRCRYGIWLGDTAIDLTSLTERKIVSLQSNLAAGNRSVIMIGQSASSYNYGIVAHNHSATGSASNFFSIGCFRNDNVMVVKYNGCVGIGTTTPVAGLDIRNTNTYSLGAGGTSYQFYGHSLFQNPITSNTYSDLGPYNITLGLYVAGNAMFFGSLYCNSDQRLKKT